MDLGVLDHTETMRHLGVMTIKNRKDRFDETQKSPALEVKVTYHMYQHGIEIRLQPMKTDLTPGL